jgi:hypothetical protein
MPLHNPRSRPRRYVPKALFAWWLLCWLPGCPALTEPPSGTASVDAAGTPATAPQKQAPPQVKLGERIEASHILFAYQGSPGVPPEVTRSKEQARQQAESVLQQIRKGANFADLARRLSDDPSSKNAGGSLGSFARTDMNTPFATAAFALKPGELSGVVESQFGFHIIKRDK